MNINGNNIIAYKPLFTTDGIFSNAATNTFYVGGGNNFDATAITNPKVRNGIAIGNGDYYTSSVFNNAINSWCGTGFVDTCNKRCYCSIDHRTGNFYTLGFFSAGNSVYTPVIKGINGLEYDTTTSTGIHNFKNNGVQKMYLNNTDLTNTINLTQIGNATFSNLITVNGQSTFNGLINALSGITLGSSNTDAVNIVTNIIGGNITELALIPGDDGSGSTLSLPPSGESNSQDYVTIRSTNAGVHHAFSTSGNYYCAGQIVAANIVADTVTANSFIGKHTELPDLTGGQLGGSYFIGYYVPLNYYTGFHSMSQILPIGYYLAVGYIAITPSAISLTLSFGLGANDSTFLDDYIHTQKTTSLDKIYKQFTHYLKVTTATTYYLNLYNGGIYDWPLTRYYCDFIRIG